MGRAYLDNVRFGIWAIVDAKEYRRRRWREESADDLLVDAYADPERTCGAWRGARYRQLEFALISNGEDLLGGHFWSEHTAFTIDPLAWLVHKFLEQGDAQVDIEEPLPLRLKAKTGRWATLHVGDEHAAFTVETKPFLHDMACELIRYDAWQARWLGCHLDSWIPLPAGSGPNPSDPANLQPLLHRVDAL